MLLVIICIFIFIILLIVGEIVEMLGMYLLGEYDLVGFVVGVVEWDYVFLWIESIRLDDVVIGLVFFGIYSNGFSLVRWIIDVFGLDYSLFCLFIIIEGL